MILVTGASGLVGSHLLFQLLEKGLAVRALIRTEDSVAKIRSVFDYYCDTPDDLIQKVSWAYGDVTDMQSLYEAFIGVSKVYHCAAYISFSKRHLHHMETVNVTGTSNVVNICLQNAVDKLVHVSSIAAVGKTKGRALVSEEDKWPQGDISPYALTKTKSELEIWRGISEGLCAVIVNPSVILGPGNWQSGSGKLFSQTNKGMLFYTSGSTGFVDVRDVVEIMQMLMMSDIQAERFILNAENMHYRDLFVRIAKCLGVNAPKCYAKPALMGIAWRIERVLEFLLGRAPTLTRFSARSAYAEQQYSSEKVQKILNYSFKSIDDAIEHAAKMFLKS